jgi:hypothetical protein
LFVMLNNGLLCNQHVLMHSSRMTMKKPKCQAKTSNQNVLVKRLALLSLVVLVIVTGTVSATVFTTNMNNAKNSCPLKTPDVRLVAGSDSSSSITTFPSASVSIAPTYQYATVSFSLFPSAINIPQPETYYTNLLQIKNVGTASYAINSITISGITGAANLGSVTIYFYDIQTDTPGTPSPVASTILTSGSSGTISLFSGTQTLAASGINYIEIVGYAAPGAATGSTVGFTLNIQCGSSLSPTPLPTPTPTPTPRPTPAPRPTCTPKPTPAPRPTCTPKPTQPAR